MTSSNRTPSIGLALGSGASRGWSHIGVIKALSRAGIEPDVVCGTSVGAIIGGSYVAGNLEKLEHWVLGSRRIDVLRFFDIKFSRAGFVDDERMENFLHNYVAAPGVRIEDLSKKYIAVCTDLGSGDEVWLRRGGLVNAVRASMAMPGLFPAVRDQQRWLVDGGLVNPVPVTACRALGADVVIAVNLNSDIVGGRNKRAAAAGPRAEPGVLGKLKQQVTEYSNSANSHADDADRAPGSFYTVATSIKIFQDRITRRRLADDPADVLIAPRLGDIGLLDFQRAAEAIGTGEACVDNALEEIGQILGS